MKTHRLIHLSVVLIALLLASLACDLPFEFAAQEGPPDATQTMQVLATRVAATLESQADTGQEVTSAEDSAAAEPAAEAAAVTPTITLTPTLGAPMVSVSVDTNCRFGPGNVYEYQGALLVGEEALITGKLADESFWYIENPDPPPPQCWIWGAYAQVEGDTSGVPILTPPPTPTPEYTPTPELFSVSGTVFHDWNENGLREATENGMPNFQIDLREDNCGGTIVAQAFSDSSGQFTFSGIPPGTYWIGVYYPSIWCMLDVRVNTRPTSYTFQLGPDRQFLFGFNCQVMGP